MNLKAVCEVYPLREPFVISRGARTEQTVVVAELADGIHRGRGEGTPYARDGETAAGVLAAIESMAPQIVRGLDRQRLQQIMPPGAARNAIDCALWDLQAKRAGRPVWALAGLPAPRPQVTAFTISLGPPAIMRDRAASSSWRPLLKIKLGGAGDLARLEAVRAGAPRALIIVDANEGWSAAEYAALAPGLRRLGVVMIEQPLPAGSDEALATLPRPVPVCADESCRDRSSLSGLRGKYDLVNIKLDKAGGLTEALALREAALAADFGIMVGSMVGTSLAMAPALLVAQDAAFVDLDGPLLLGRDRQPGMRYDEAGVHPADPALWG